MSITYTWHDEEHTLLLRDDSEGDSWIIPASEANKFYVEFLESEATAAPYVAPPEPEPLTTEEKVNRMLRLGSVAEYIGHRAKSTCGTRNLVASQGDR